MGVLIATANGTQRPPTPPQFTHGASGLFPRGAIASEIITETEAVLGFINSDSILDVFYVEPVNRLVASARVALGTGDGRFVPLPGFVTGGYFPGNPRLADFNGDGRTDLCVGIGPTPFGSPRQIMIHYATPTGSFDNGLSLFPNAMTSCLADLDRDGRCDIVMLKGFPNNPDSVVVGFFQGEGNFESHTVAHHASRAHATDFDGDGDLDLAIGNRLAQGGSDSITVLSCHPDRAFETVAQLPLPRVCQVVRFADLDGDGQDEIVVTDYQSIQILKRTANGLAETWGGYPSANAVECGDIDGDGQLDLILSGQSLSILHGDGAGGVRFASRIQKQGFALVADTDQDSVDDLVMLPVLSTYRGGEGIDELGSDYSTILGPTDLAIGDLEGDGDPDVIVAIRGQVGAGIDNRISVYLNSGTGGLKRAHDYVVGLGPSSLALGDANGDGRLDVVVEGNPTTVLIGNGDGTFGPALDVGNFLGLQVGHFDLDPYLDVATRVSGGVQLAYGTGTGAFTPGAVHPAVLEEMFVVDVNADGLSDLILRASTTVTTMLARSDRTTQLAGTVAVPQGCGITAGYFDSDASVDLLVGEHLLLGLGDGSFTAPAQQPAWPLALGCDRRMADLDRDGIQDVATIGSSSGLTTNLVGVVLNRPAGLESAGFYGASPTPCAFEIADMNNDGWPDLVTVNGGTNTITVLLNHGGAPVDVATGGGQASAIDFEFIHGQSGGVTIRWRNSGSAQAISIFDVRGRRLTSLRPQGASTEWSTAFWDRLDSHGARVGRGTYFVKRIQAAGRTSVGKVVIRSP